MKKYYYLLFLLFYNHRIYIEAINRISCMANEKILNIGEKYIKYGDYCQICTCTSNSEDICDKILNCENLNCEKPDIHEDRCCKKLKCKGIY